MANGYGKRLEPSQAAAGADGMLVAHLRDEVDYRQRLVDAQAEQ